MRAMFVKMTPISQMMAVSKQRITRDSLRHHVRTQLQSDEDFLSLSSKTVKEEKKERKKVKSK